MKPATCPPLLALTMGDPAGIGPDLALMAWQRRRVDAIPPFILIGSPAVLEDRARRMGLDVALICCRPGEAGERFDEALPILPAGPDCAVAAGEPDPATAPMTLAALDAGIDLVKAGDVSALVTNPIAKHVLKSAGFAHPGHTEYLAARAVSDGEAPPHPVMMLWSPLLAVVPVTIHVALREVPDLLTTELILRTGRIVAHDLQRRFGLCAPRLSVAGLNPHAGENGTMGDEDERIVRPAVEQLKAEGIDVSGPFSADTMFHPEARRQADVVLAMYHDQALIPLKTLAFDDGVNVTLGLPFIRTSPDHGTAFGLAGTGHARPSSLIAALKLAARMGAV